MVKSLLLLSALIGVNSMPVASNCNDQYYGVQEKQYQHTEDVGNTQVTYKYETNEVNSVSDLVVGNIYKLDLTSYTPTTSINIVDFYYIYCYISDFDITFEATTEFGRLQSATGSYRVNLFINNDWSTFARPTIGLFYFVYYRGFDSSFISYVSQSDYNVIESVEYIPPTTIFGHLAEVLGDNLYGGIPNVDNVIFTIGGQDITLKSWLVTSTCIVLAVVLITILCLFIRWLFKLFSNTILLR